MTASRSGRCAGKGIDRSGAKAVFRRDNWQKPGNALNSDRDNAVSVAEKRADYMQRWTTSSGEQQAELTVRPGDGI